MAISGGPRTIWKFSNEGAVPQIQPFATDTVLFVLPTQRGPVDEIVLVNSFPEFQLIFGEEPLTGYEKEYFNVKHYFTATEGNGKAYIIRVVHHTAQGDPSTKDTTVADCTATNTDTYIVHFYAKNDGSWGNDIKLTISKDGYLDDHYKVTVTYGNYTNTYFVNNDPSSYKYWKTVLNNDPFIKVTENSSGTTLMKEGTDMEFQGGTDSSQITNEDIIGARNSLTGEATGLHLADDVINEPTGPYLIVDPYAIPEITQAFEAYANTNWVEVISAVPYGLNIQEAINYRTGKGSYTISLTSNYGRIALYYPWVLMTSLKNTKYADIYIPPSGFVAGRCVLTNVTAGLHIPPANRYGTFIDITKLEREVNQVYVDAFYPYGINPLHSKRKAIWGTKTTATDSRYDRISTMIQWNYIKRSVDYGTSWVLHMPNIPQYADLVVAQIRSFLYGLAFEGGRPTGFFDGTTESQMYRVTNITTASDKANNILRIKIECNLPYIIDFLVFELVRMKPTEQ